MSRRDIIASKFWLRFQNFAKQDIQSARKKTRTRRPSVPHEIMLSWSPHRMNWFVRFECSLALMYCRDTLETIQPSKCITSRHSFKRSFLHAVCRYDLWKLKASAEKEWKISRKACSFTMLANVSRRWTSQTVPPGTPLFGHRRSSSMQRQCWIAPNEH